MRLEIPPLRERKGDIPLLINHILKQLCVDRDIPAPRVSQCAMEVLLNHDYPGNVRELENILEHCLVVCQGEEIERRHLPVPLIKKTEKFQKTESKDNTIEPGQEEEETIREMLEKYKWNKTRTAQELNMDRSTLWRKIKKYNIEETLY
jgi:DNA-binding NtrC family response regulator